MATTTTQTLIPVSVPIPKPKPMRVCFSFAAYAKILIAHLKSINVPILDGLSETEFSTIESSLNFTFPPDLRSILREGLPVAPGFPNWRASSFQQLHLLASLPILSICKEISNKKFWCESWGREPHNADEALALAKQFLMDAPVLVPIYRNCYIPSSPNIAGNPVFLVQGGDVRLLSFDVARFFENVDLKEAGAFRTASLSMKAPAWAATTARRIEVWTELAEGGRREGESGGTPTRGWWSGELGACLEGVLRKLRDGGWREEEVREMMMVMDGGDETNETLKDREAVAWHMRRLSVIMLRAGWRIGDVAYALGFKDESFLPRGDARVDIQHPSSSFTETWSG